VRASEVPSSSALSPGGGAGGGRCVLGGNRTGQEGLEGETEVQRIQTGSGMGQGVKGGW
jgi:hypothetical protein